MENVNTAPEVKTFNTVKPLGYITYNPTNKNYSTWVGKGTLPNGEELFAVLADSDILIHTHPGQLLPQNMEHLVGVLQAKIKEYKFDIDHPASKSEYWVTLYYLSHKARSHVETYNSLKPRKRKPYLSESDFVESVVDFFEETTKILNTLTNNDTALTLNVINTFTALINLMENNVRDAFEDHINTITDKLIELNPENTKHILKALTVT